MQITGKEGLLRQTGREIDNVFQNLFKRRGKWRRKASEVSHFYSKEAPRAVNDDKLIICMCDGRMDHGGIADRLRGIISTYYLCKKEDLSFRIFFNHPFRLEDYLVPAKYDWRIPQSELCYNSNDSSFVFCGSNNTTVETFFQAQWLKKHFREAKKQLHVYTNAHLIRDNRYSHLFRELFKPSERLDKALAHYSKQFESEGYISVSLRFIGLLGDFSERDERHISPIQQEILMRRCVEKIQQIHHQYATKKKVLLTSDSTRFLNYAAEQLPFVHFIPGKVLHIDYQDSTSDDINMKLFVDMFMISRSERAFLLQTGEMYNSGFPRRAAQITDIPFHHIRF